MKKIEVLLLYPPDRNKVHYSRRPPLSLMYLASYLEKKGIKTDILDRQLKSKDAVLLDLEEKIVRLVKNSPARFIGISCYTPEYGATLRLAKNIKSLNLRKTIIVGGIHPTLKPQDFIYPGSPVDFVVIGEGERTLFELVTALKAKAALSHVDGLGYLKSGKIHKTKPRELISNLDEIPFPAFGRVNMKFYTRPSPFSIRGVYLSSFYILTSRGCPSLCTFCVAKKLRSIYGRGKCVRSRSPENILKEVLFLRKKYNIDSFYIIDDFFAIDQKNTIRFCQLLVKSKVNILWGCETKVTALNEETVFWMKKSGCIQIDFGVESGSQRLLNLIKKGITVKTTKKVFALCRKYGIRTFANILLNIPGETKKDLALTLSLLKTIRPTVTAFNIFTPYLGTEIYDRAPKKLKKDEYHLLGLPAAELIKMDPGRFLFARHRVDIDKFAISHQRALNGTFAALKFHFSLKYWSFLLRSKRKNEYLVGIRNLLTEYVKQKFGR